MTQLSAVNRRTDQARRRLPMERQRPMELRADILQAFDIDASPPWSSKRSSGQDEADSLPSLDHGSPYSYLTHA
jgi:hypothetical protein